MDHDRHPEGDLHRFEARHSPEGLLARYARGRIATFWIRQTFPLAGTLPLALLTDPAVAIIAMLVVVAGEAVECLMLRSLLRRYPDGVLPSRLRHAPAAAALVQALSGVGVIWLVLWLLDDASGHVILIAMLAGGALNAGQTLSYVPRIVAMRLAVYGCAAVSILLRELLAGFSPQVVANHALGLFVAGHLIWLAIADIRRGFNRRVASQRALLRKSIEAEEARRELAVREVENRRLAQVARHASDSVFITDNDNRIEFANETFTRMSGCSLEEALGRRLQDLFRGPDYDAEALDAISAAIEERRPIRAEVRRPEGDRPEAWFEANISPLVDDQGRPDGCVAVTRDMTEAKRREAELQRASLVAKHANDGVLIADASGGVEYVNEAFLRMTGYARPDLIGRKVGSLFADPEADPGLRQRISASIRSMTPVRAELLLLDRGGNRAWVESSITPLTDADGTLAGHINVTRDVSEAKRREEEINRLSLVARHASDGVVITGPEGHVDWVNPTFVSRTGLDFDEVVGQPAHEIFGPLGGDPETLRRVAEAVSRRQPLRTDFRYRSKSGEAIWVETQMTPILADDGSLAGYIAVERDVWEAKTREAELAEAKATAEEALQAKTRFLATMSHEIRTPLNGIIGTADLLASSALDDAQSTYVDTLVQSGEALLTIVNDILEMTRLEAGRVDLVEDPFGVAESVDAVVRLMRPAAESKGLRIAGAVSPDLPPHLAGDAGRLRQILLNLAGNAIKFTERGEVRLSARPGGDGMTEFVVEDTGIGIAPERLEAVFESFTQEDGLTSRRFGGTGLGLTISRMLARAMGGDLVAASTPGAGSNFTLRLPLRASLGKAAPAPAAPVAPAVPEAFAGRRVLVAEDNKANRFLIARFLADLGLDVRFAEDGGAAVDAFVAERPDVVLMDVSMPVMDGLAATREIRRLEGGAPRCPIVGLTANAFEEDRRRCLDAGMTGFMAKPVKRSVLVAALGDALRQTPPGMLAAE